MTDAMSIHRAGNGARGPSPSACFGRYPVRAWFDEAGIELAYLRPRDSLRAAPGERQPTASRDANLIVPMIDDTLMHDTLRPRPRGLGLGLFWIVPDAVIAADAETGRIALWNPAAEALFGYSSAEAVGLPLEALVPERLRGTRWSSLASALGRPRELVGVRKTGEEIAIEVTLSRTEQGTSGGPFVLAIVRDVSERRRAEDRAVRPRRQAALRADVSAALTQRGTLPSTLQRCAEAMVRHLGAALARIWTLDEADQVLELQASAGQFTHLDGAHGRVPVGQLKIGSIAQEQRPYLTNDVIGDPHVGDQDWAQREGMVSFAGYPLAVEGRPVGVMAMFAREPLPEDTLEMLASVADAIAQGIERKQAEAAREESDERYRSVIAALEEGITLHEADGTVGACNASAERILGLSADQITGRSMLDPRWRTVYDDGSPFQPEDYPVMVALRTGRAQSGVVMGVHTPEEQLRWISVSARPLFRDGDSKPYAAVASFTDITERNRSAHALDRERQFLKAVLEHVQAGIVACDANGVLTVFNRATRELHGLPEEPIPADRWAEHYDLYRPDGKTPMRTEEIPLFRALQGERLNGVEMAIVPKGGVARTLVASGQAIVDAEGQKHGAVVAMLDITERKRLEEQLTHQAHYDAVTGLANRTLFMERLARALTRRRRRTGVAVLFVDLDGFKVINDSLGHGAGDTLLGLVGGRLAGCLRAGDTPARFGGDEFTVLLEDVPDPSAAVHTAERVIDTLRQPFTLGRRQVFMMASIGITHRMPGGALARPEDLVREADTALYQAKAAGKARVAVFDPSMNARVLERLDLETDLQRAVERGELRLHYEPEVDLASGQIVGVEALVRWQHPRRGLLHPADFIAIAEETGLVVPIGRWVLAEACRQARAWQAQHPSDPPLVISVNLSAREFQQPDLVARVAAVLREYGVAEGSLRLEITERVIMDDAPATETVLEALRALGVRLALDDFGTGYSSLGYLQRFPVDTLKIDRAFVTPLAQSEQALAIVRAAVALGHALEMAVTAEGIETAEQLARACTAGCDRGQGYFFTRPVPSEAMGALIASGLPYPANPGAEQRNRPA